MIGWPSYWTCAWDLLLQLWWWILWTERGCHHGLPCLTNCLRLRKSNYHQDLHCFSSRQSCVSICGREEYGLLREPQNTLSDCNSTQTRASQYWRNDDYIGHLWVMDYHVPQEKTDRSIHIPTQLDERKMKRSTIKAELNHCLDTLADSLACTGQSSSHLGQSKIFVGS